MELSRGTAFDPFTDRFLGSFLGLVTGDALGAPVEGWPWKRIKDRLGWLEKMIPGRLPAGSYTDDGQMALGLLESLVEANRFCPNRFYPALCAARWLANFDPNRGYGGRLDGIMARLKAGEPWDQVGTDSFGNGSAMRVGPLGAWYFRDPGEITRTARTSASITHGHPQALAGAVVQALAVGQALNLGLKGQSPIPNEFMTPLIESARKIDPETARRLEPLNKIAPKGRGEQRRNLTSLFACDVRAIESVGPALGAFLGTISFKEAVTLAVNLGNDTDTLGAMAGAVAGAFYGLSAIPEDWLGALENKPGSGRDYMIELGLRGVDLIG